ncbi:MAG TPA: hypothetical protein VFA33_18530 [Bryobacteraceae bacterium]|nr:hypothetical protein [Bryobacteraceae bacterium]
MLKRFILWDFPRGSWQYDVMVGIILAFVFLTPRAWFRDQPRIPQFAMLPSEHEASVLWMEPALLAGVAESDRLARANQLLQSHTGQKQLVIVRVEPIYDTEGEIKGYMAFPKR